MEIKVKVSELQTTLNWVLTVFQTCSLKTVPPAAEETIQVLSAAFPRMTSLRARSCYVSTKVPSYTGHLKPTLYFLHSMSHTHTHTHGAVCDGVIHTEGRLHTQGLHLTAVVVTSTHSAASRIQPSRRSPNAWIAVCPCVWSVIRNKDKYTCPSRIII